jgi:hypothetical protein
VGGESPGSSALIARPICEIGREALDESFLTPAPGLKSGWTELKLAARFFGGDCSAVAVRAGDTDLRFRNGGTFSLSPDVCSTGAGGFGKGFGGSDVGESMGKYCEKRAEWCLEGD